MLSMKAPCKLCCCYYWMPPTYLLEYKPMHYSHCPHFIFAWTDSQTFVHSAFILIQNLLFRFNLPHPTIENGDSCE